VSTCSCFFLTESGKLLQVIDVFGSAARQFVSLEIRKADDGPPNALEVSEDRGGPAFFEGHAANFVHHYDAGRSDRLSHLRTGPNSHSLFPRKTQAETLFGCAMNIPEDPVKIRVFGTPASAICLH
jgi:hypothetical protein